MGGLFGGGGGSVAVPAPVAYTPPPQAQSPQAQVAGQAAATKAENSGGIGAALAGMAPGGLAQPASTTQKQALGG